MKGHIAARIYWIRLTILTAFQIFPYTLQQVGRYLKTAPSPGLIELWFYAPLDTKYVILETFPQANLLAYTHTHTHNRLMALSPGLPGWASTRKVKPIWILLEQETVSGSGISWAICKSAPRSRQITTPVPHHSVFYRPDALPAA